MARRKQDRGFASMDKEKQRRIASKGGKAAHKSGRAHEWTREEARIAGRKGGSVKRAPQPKTPSPTEAQQADANLVDLSTRDQTGGDR